MVTAARVARRYYVDNRSKVQIAGELGMTRFNVARLRELARASGLVSISAVGAGSLGLDLSQRLCERCGLRHAVVVNTTRGNDAETRDWIGEVAADPVVSLRPERHGSRCREAGHADRRGREGQAVLETQ
jgi:DNA-binding transcriptional regulator LsrR (DeoR family)